MLPSDRALATSCMLSIVTMSPFATVWPQFLMESFKLLVAVSQKRYKMRPMLLLITNRKSHIGFQITSKSLTSNDLKN